MNKTLNDLLIIFGRYPEPGKTKTRLISALGPAGAADLQRRLTEDIFRTAVSSASKNDFDIQFCFEGGDSTKIKKWLGPDVSCQPQTEGDIGGRMSSALNDAFGNGRKRVVLIGTDIQEIKESDIKDAFTALAKHNLVLGPSADGGYWLVGLKEPADIFNGIMWSTEKVLLQTTAIADKKGLDYCLLDTKTDIDTIEDLEKIYPDKTKN